MVDHDLVPGRISSEWHVHELAWWLRIEADSAKTSLIEEIFFLEDDLELLEPVSGEFSVSENDFRLWRFIPVQDVVDAHMAEWVALYGKEYSSFFNGVLKSMRRLCRYTFFSCGAARNGFDIGFKNTTLASLLEREIILLVSHLVGYGADVIKIVDATELLTLLLRCVMDSENRTIFDQIFKVLAEFPVEWVEERLRLFEILRGSGLLMSDWHEYLDSVACIQVAMKIDVADFSMIQAALINSRANMTKKRRL